MDRDSRPQTVYTPSYDPIILNNDWVINLKKPEEPLEGVFGSSDFIKIQRSKYDEYAEDTDADDECEWCGCDCDCDEAPSGITTTSVIEPAMFDNSPTELRPDDIDRAWDLMMNDNTEYERRTKLLSDALLASQYQYNREFPQKDSPIARFRRYQPLLVPPKDGDIWTDANGHYWLYQNNRYAMIGNSDPASIKVKEQVQMKEDPMFNKFKKYFTKQGEPMLNQEETDRKDAYVLFYEEGLGQGKMKMPLKSDIVSDKIRYGSGFKDDYLFDYEDVQVYIRKHLADKKSNILVAKVTKLVAVSIAQVG